MRDKPTYAQVVAMTRDELKAAQSSLGLTNQQLADALKVSLRAVEMWRQGARPIPGPVEVAITLMLNQLDGCAAFVATHT